MSELELVRMTLLKQGQFRSYDELTLLKSYLSKSDFIKNTLSSSMLPKQVDELCRSLLLESFSSGEYVFRQGDPGDKMYIILSGSCEVRLKQKVELAHGESELREKVLFVCQPGQHFGERALSEDQPRAASIVCVEDNTDLITISKRIYNLLLKSAHADATSMGGMTDQPGTKPFVLKVLSKRRETRTPLEIESVAGYLNWRIPFFQKFTQDQQLELCRVSEVITIWGKTILFKQGSVGQAFYVILTGSVDVWVLSADQKDQLIHARLAGNNTVGAGTSAGIDEAALGDKVASLQMGDIFGERALENADSLRMASIVTCDQQTELLVIAREDYHKLVSALMNQEIMKKITCLRKTAMFKNAEMLYLKELAKYMEPRRYELDEFLYREGTKATDMVITECGECIVEVPVETYTDAVTTEVSGITVTHAGVRSKRKMVEVGRIAPYSVIAPYITQVQQLHDSVYHPETVTANTLVIGYTVSQHDFYTHMTREARQMVADLVKNYKAHVLPNLWDDTPLVLGEQEFRIKKAWRMYRENYLLPEGAGDKKSLTYNEALRALSIMHITPDSGNALKSSAGAKIITKTTTSANLGGFGSGGSGGGGGGGGMVSRLSRTSAGPGAGAGGAGGGGAPTDSSIVPPSELDDLDTFALDDRKNVVDMNWGIKSPKKGRNYLENITKDLNEVNPVVQRVIRNGGLGGSGAAGQATVSRSVTSAATASATDPTPAFQKLGFSLIHIHRETLQSDPTNVGPRRLLRAYLRLCGTMHSCTDAKDVAEALMKNVFHTIYNCDLARKHELQLKWKSFAGLEAMPLQNTDIFFVYCRSVPVEYACISPSEDLLCKFDYPASCKQKHQMFACARIKRLSVSRQLRSRSAIKSRGSSAGAGAGAGAGPAGNGQVNSIISAQKAPGSGSGTGGKMWRKMSSIAQGTGNFKALMHAGVGGGAGSDVSDDDDEKMPEEKEAELREAGLPIWSSEKQAHVKEKLLNPTYTEELGAFVEVLATAVSRVECLRFYKSKSAGSCEEVSNGSIPRALSLQVLPSLDNFSSDGPSGTSAHLSRPGTGGDTIGSSLLATCIFPLYEWFQISDERTRALDIENTLTQSEIAALTAGGRISGAGARSAAAPGGARVTEGDGKLQTQSQTTSNLMECFEEMGLRHQSKSRFTEVETALNPSPLPTIKVGILGDEANRKALKMAVTKRIDVDEADRKSREKEMERIKREKRKKKHSVPGAPRSPQSPTSALDRSAMSTASALETSGSVRSVSSAGGGGGAYNDSASVFSVKSKESDAGSNSSADNRFVMTADKINAMKLVLDKRAELFSLNDKLCSDENDIAELGKALREGLSTRISKRNDDDVYDDEDGDGGTQHTSIMTRELTDEEKEEMRKKRQNARRGLWESKESSPGMGLLKQRIQIYEKLVGLPTRNEIVLRGLQASSSGGSIGNSNSNSNSRSSSKGQTSSAAANTANTLSARPNLKSLNSRLEAVHTMVKTVS